MGWYLTFGYFKMAVIAQQIYARWRRRQTEDPHFAVLGDRARFTIHHARKISPRGEP
jgi:aminoglycoside phosphotransferase (APT) family kinase protein